MHKFIIKSSVFLIPFFIFYLLNVLFLNKSIGDLVNVGLFYSLKNEKIKPAKKISKYFDAIYDYDDTNINKYEVVNIGDSFSLQGVEGYQNFLAKRNISLLNIEIGVERNPINVLIGLLETNFFDKTKPKYVIIESVERKFVKRGLNVDFSPENPLSIKELQRINQRQIKMFQEPQVMFFSKETMKAPFINLFYLFNKTPTGSRAIKLETTSKLFSNLKSNDVFFFKEDLKVTPLNNDTNNIKEVNKSLNKLAATLKLKGIKLIVLVCPDKYDLYYNKIKNKKSYTKPMFFDKIKKMNKNYAFINSKQVLQDSLARNKDVYHCFDTHWSHIDADIIAGEIYKTIKP